MQVIQVCHHNSQAAIITLQEILEEKSQEEVGQGLQEIVTNIKMTGTRSAGDD